MISIHVLRVEDDTVLPDGIAWQDYFNPRPPCGGRQMHWAHGLTIFRFQSTSSVWRTTGGNFHTPYADRDFNPRPPCGGRLAVPAFKSLNSLHFNPRPPCGGRRNVMRRIAEFQNFNPRPPCGGRPGANEYIAACRRFQSTSSVWRTTEAHGGRREEVRNFNPRPPCGGRLISSSSTSSAALFQSTSSVWRTTPAHPLVGLAGVISIHVLRVEDDPPTDVKKSKTPEFQSTSSVWRTTALASSGAVVQVYFNPRPPCGGRLRPTR